MIPTFQICLLSFVVAFSIVDCKLILYQNGSQVMESKIGIWSYTQPWTSINGTLIDLRHSDYCNEGTAEMTNKIVYLEQGYGCSEEQKIRVCQKFNCKAILVLSLFVVPGLESQRFISPSTKSDVSFLIPFIYIGTKDAKTLSNLIAQNQPLQIILVNDEVNEWEEFQSSVLFLIFWVILLPTISSGTLLFAIVKFIQLARARRLTRWSVYAIISESIAAIIRIIAFCNTSTSSIYPYFVWRMSLTVSWPITIATTFAIVYIWINSLRSANVKIGFLTPSKQRILFRTFLVFAVLCILLEISASVATGLYSAPNWLYTIPSVAEGIACIFLFVLLLTFGIMIRQKLKSSADANLRSMTLFIVFSSMGLAIFIVGGLCALSSDIFGIPTGWYAIYWLLFVGLDVTSISNINAFVVSTTTRKTHSNSNAEKLQSSSIYNVKRSHSAGDKQDLEKQIPEPEKATDDATNIGLSAHPSTEGLVPADSNQTPPE